MLGWVVCAAVALGLDGSAAPGASAQTGQVRARDQVAFAAARAVTEPQARVNALMGFVREFPESALAVRANLLALETDLAAFPERTEEIHALATRDIEEMPAGLERWLEEARVADLLASAGASGADLADARRWAQEALAALTEESFRRQTTAEEAKYKLPPLTPGQIHRDYVGHRAAFLAALANVELRANEPGAAEPRLAEAYRLRPLSSEVNRLRGELALVRHRDAEALEDLERAAATGTLREPWRGEMVRLYEAGNADGEAGLEQKIDAVYRGLYPPVFALRPRRLPAGGHTVLLELFTGAGCEPCVAPDLAVESLLDTYGRKDLVVLEYDENIPRPDPLTNRSSEARAIAYGVGTTPEAFLDGEPLPVPGAAREDAENVVVGFADAVEQSAVESTGVRLALTAARTAAGQITARATASADATGAAALRRGEWHFALVQDHVRYSGENGIRFHRMVVRAVESGARADAAGGGTAAEAKFDLPAIALQLRSYLDAYEKGNDRYGEVHFAEKDFPLDPAQLAVVAWVEDPGTHEVLNAAYAPVPAS